MSQPVKVFTVQQGAEVDPIPFDLEFRPADGGEPRVEHFEAYGEAPAGATLLLSSIMRFDDRGRQRADLNGMTAWFGRVLADDQYRRFMDLLDDPKLLVPMETLGDVFNFLIEHYTNRPTRPSPTSSDGRREIGASSTGPQPSGASTS